MFKVKVDNTKPHPLQRFSTKQEFFLNSHEISVRNCCKRQVIAVDDYSALEIILINYTCYMLLSRLKRE